MTKPAHTRAFEIRLARSDEAETVSRLLREAFGPYRSGYTVDAFEYTTPTAETIESRFAEGPIWLAVDGEEVIGTVSVMSDDGRLYIRSMAVTPTAQGRGVGRQLLETLESYAREKGFKKLYLYTTFVLPVARPMYEKNGFYVIRETPPEEWFGVGGIEMEKIID
ncbi:MAG: GNAT family N-acetyltransferase [Pyrinomonadaceae bacterium]